MDPLPSREQKLALAGDDILAGLTPVFASQIREAREAGIEEQLDFVGRAVGMLFDEDLRAIVYAFELLYPVIIIGCAGLGLARLQIIFFAIDEHHHVGV